MTIGTLLKIERFDFCHFLKVCLLDANHNIETSFQIFDGRDLCYLRTKLFVQGKSIQLRIINFSTVTFAKNCQKPSILGQSGGHPLKRPIFKNSEFFIVGCHKSVPGMCRHIIFNNMDYIHSINTFVKQKVCAHKRHIIWGGFSHTIRKNTI